MSHDTRLLGSLFSGYGGLDLAVEHHYQATQAWHCELDPHASAVLAAHWDTPNLGDITAVDWTQVEPVDVLCGGFPCQDISTAGLGAGIKEGTRSGLWYRYTDAVRHLRPRHVVVENVSALLVRGLDVVLGDLASLGYDAEWCSVRASDVGAPHRRERIFLVATDTEGVGQQRCREPRSGGTGSTDRGVTAANSDRDGLGGLEGPSAGRDALWADVGRDADRRGRVSAADAGGERHGGGQVGGVVGLLDRPNADRARERERPRQVPGDRSPEAWGPYRDAIERWEHLTRPAPDPTVDGRLSPWFVEWMMGLPEGWVCDYVDRRPALRILGNGVVPQQAAAALDLLKGAA